MATGKVFKFLLLISSLKIIIAVQQCDFNSSEICVCSTQDQEDQEVVELVLNREETGDISITYSKSDFLSKMIFSATLDKNLIKIKTNSDVSIVDEEIHKKGIISIAIIVTFTTSTDTFIRSVTISMNDVDNHAPELLGDLSLKVPNVLYPKVEIFAFGKGVTARDIDFSNENIIFTLKGDKFPEDQFECNSKVVDGSNFKEFNAFCYSKTTLSLDEIVSLKLTAKDEGGLEGFAEVQLNIDPDVILDIPSFEKSMYNFNYDGNDIVGDKIRYNSKVPEKLKISWDGEFKDNIDCTKNEEKEIKCTVTKKLESTESSSVLILTVETDYAANAPLVIKMPLSDFHFLKNLYTGTYVANTDPPTIKLNKDITTSKEVKSAEVDENYASYVQVKCTNMKCDFEVIKPLPENILQNSEISMVISAISIADETTESVFKLSLPSYPEFEKDFYFSEYTEGVIIPNEPIKIININSELTIGIKEDNLKTVFESSYDEEKKEVTITVKDPGSDELKGKTEITVTLILNAVSETSVIIKFPINDIKFEKPLYNAKYTEKADKLIVEPIKVTGNNVKMEIEEKFSKYFEPVPVESDGSWNIFVTNKLEPEILTKYSYLSVILTASYETFFDTTIIQIELPQLPQFSESYYFGKYILKDGSYSVELEDNIKISNVNEFDNIVPSIDEKYQKYFQIELVGEGEYIIKVDEVLPPEILYSAASLTILLTASGNENPNKAQTSCILTLPPQSGEDIPNFGRSHYIASYKEDNAILEQPITVSAKNDLVTVQIEEQQSYFSIIFHEDSEDYSIKTLQPLPPEELMKSFLIYTLKVVSKESDEGKIGYSTLLINLPKQSAQLQFTQNSYSASYYFVDGQSQINLETIIEVTTTCSDKVILSLDNEFTDYFKINPKGENKWNIETLNDLPEEDLEKLILIIQLTASCNDIFSYSTLIITMPSVKCKINFQEFVFSAEYSDKDEFKTESEIKITSIENGLTIDIQGDYSSFFTATLNQDTGLVTINKNKNLPEEIKKEKPVVMLILNIITKTGEKAGSAIVNIRTPAFDKNYSEDNDDCSKTGLIAGVIVLAVLFALSLIGTGLLYYFKIRSKSTNFLLLETSSEKKIGYRKSSTSKLEPKVGKPKRRSTGFLNEPISLNVDNEINNNNNNISFGTEPDQIIDEIEVEGNMKPVSERRPTQFVFKEDFTGESSEIENKPNDITVENLENESKSENVIDIQDDPGIIEEPKKNVVFNEMVEEVEIERGEDVESENEEGEHNSEDKENDIKESPLI